MMMFLPTDLEAGQIQTHLAKQSEDTLRHWINLSQLLASHAKAMGKRKIRWSDSDPAEPADKVWMVCNQTIQLCHAELKKREA